MTIRCDNPVMPSRKTFVHKDESFGSEVSAMANRVRHIGWAYDKLVQDHFALGQDNEHLVYLGVYFMEMIDRWMEEMSNGAEANQKWCRDNLPSKIALHPEAQSS